MDKPTRLAALASLEQQLHSLIERFSALAKAAQAEIVSPLSQGGIPNPTVVDDIRDTIADARAAVESVRAAGLIVQGPVRLPELVQSLSQIAQGESWTAIQEECRPHAERVLRITHKSGLTPPFIQDLRARATRCLEELASDSPPMDAARETWQSRVRPFQDLWLLLNEPDSLNDSQAEEALARIEQELSRSVVSAITLRRLIVLPQDVAPPQSVAQEGPTMATSPSPAAIEAPQPAVALDTTETSAPSPATSADAPPAATELSNPPVEPAPAAPAPPRAVPTPRVITPIVAAAPAEKEAVPATRPTPSRPQTTTPRETILSPERCSDLRNLIWRMVGGNRAGLAYQLALCGESLAPPEDMEPSCLLGAAVLGPAVRSSSGEVVDRFRKYVEELQTWLPRWQGADEHALAARLTLFGLSLRPTLLAPEAGALSLLTAIAVIDALSPALSEIRRSIAEFGGLNLEMSPGVLKGVHDHAVWQQQVDDIRTEARGWLDHNRHANIIYAPTTDVWHRWLERDGSLGRGLEIVVNQQVNRLDEVRHAVRAWSDRKHVEKELARTDEEIRKIGSRRRPIEGGARTAICKRAQEFVHIAQRWLDILAAEPRSLDDFRQQRADRCRTVVQRALVSAQADVAALANAGGTSAALPAAVRFVQVNLDDIRQLFDAHSQETAESLSVPVLLGEELLALPSIQLDANWQPLGATLPSLLEELQKASAQPFDPRIAFAKQSEVRNHLATQRIIEALTARPSAQVLAESLRTQREEAVHQCRQALRRQLDETQQHIEQAVCYDLITDEERNRFSGLVQDCRFLSDVEEIADFGHEQKKLETIDAAIDHKRKQRIAEVRQKLSDTTVPPDRRGDLDVVRQALDRGDFLSADEYIELIRKGQPLVRAAEPTRTVLSEFFPAFVQRFNAFMEGDGRNRPDQRDMPDRIRERRGVGPLDMHGVPGPQAAEAADMVNAWIRLKSRPASPAKDLTALLTAIGFRNVNITVAASPKSPHWLAICQCTPLGDPNICIIPHFGSQAKGRYHILGLFERPDEEAIVNLVRAAAGTEPTIVLYFGRMTEQRRRDLAELCWQRRRSFLTVDEALIFFLCGERFSRLPILVQCALPFTVAEPYTTTASLVAVEMFFGREQERRSVFDLHGTNLVYGGRQLGKSALLRDLERREHDPAEARIVRWIDLKNRGIGIDRPAQDLWAVLGQELHEEKVLPRMATTHQTVVDRIKEWLKGADDRRILLLLDEADAFLEADSRAVSEQTRHSFPEVARLKGLMDDTKRRFKVVFAGLHNVQRAARDPNTPVAHLGTPVCIGPLLDNGEWRQARDLIDIPLRHMGYEFQPPDLWMRILSYTNYYPSLVQVFCKHLLEYLHNRDRTTFDFRKSPPYPVTAQQIEEVYQSEALQGEIRHKFELTLGLDERYRLIALCIALTSIEERDARAMVDGFDVAWVREQALAWWANGFAQDTSYELFRTILDEMIGLGILRRAGPDSYALRSPNVLNLLGSKAQIEQRMFDVVHLPPPPTYEAASFHRSLNSDCWTRSPLTAEQEASLIEPTNGVAILYGSTLSGLNLVPGALTFIPSQGGVRIAKAVTQLRQFMDWLKEVDKTRSESEGVTLAVIPSDARWSAAWVNAAHEFLRLKISSKKRFLRALFVADPDMAWDWCEGGAHTQLGLAELSLKPWREAALRRWLEDAEFGPDAVASCAQILGQTGGWGFLVQALGEVCRGKPHNWREELAKLRLSWPADSRWRGCCELPQAVLPVLQVMADWDGPIGSIDVATLAPGADVSRTLRWADRLSYVREVEPDRWIVDPLVRSAVQAKG